MWFLISFLYLSCVHYGILIILCFIILYLLYYVQIIVKNCHSGIYLFQPRFYLNVQYVGIDNFDLSTKYVNLWKLTYLGFFNKIKWLIAINNKLPNINRYGKSYKVPK